MVHQVHSEEQEVVSEDMGSQGRACLRDAHRRLDVKAHPWGGGGGPLIVRPLILMTDLVYTGLDLSPSGLAESISGCEIEGGEIGWIYDCCSSLEFDKEAAITSTQQYNVR